MVVNKHMHMQHPWIYTPTPIDGTHLTHWGQDEIDIILQTTFWNAPLNENARLSIGISLDIVH